MVCKEFKIRHWKLKNKQVTTLELVTKRICLKLAFFCQSPIAILSISIKTICQFLMNLQPDTMSPIASQNSFLKKAATPVPDINCLIAVSIDSLMDLIIDHFKRKFVLL